jgi:alkylation response protein AidB-like acyl-CoA dehydrogenase
MTDMTDDDVRAEVRAWLADNVDPALGRAEWSQKVFDAGWSAPSWEPAWGGRGLSSAQSRLVATEFANVGAYGTGADRADMLSCTVRDLGTEEQKHRLIPPSVRGETRWCLLYSEPGAGSDLAGLRTRADRDGDDWIVNGQKVWTSFAKTADYGLLVARTDWDVPKHKGISFFIFPMRQPGVEIRPIHQITGESEFNEVFITDARVHDSHRLGDLNAGWWVLQTALMYERVAMGGGRRGPAMRSTKGATAAAHGSIPSPDISLLALARKTGKSADHHFRQELMRLHCMRMTNEWNGERARAAAEAGGASPLASLGKLYMAQILHYAARIQGHLLGMEASLLGDEDSVTFAHNYSQLNAYFFSIGGGTDQIQRNIIGERVLGLPKEPETDREVAFKNVPASTTRR